MAIRYNARELTITGSQQEIDAVHAAMREHDELVADIEVEMNRPRTAEEEAEELANTPRMPTHIKIFCGLLGICWVYGMFHAPGAFLIMGISFAIGMAFFSDFYAWIR